jgi:hypothetical protein
MDEQSRKVEIIGRGLAKLQPMGRMPVEMLPDAASPSTETTG